MTMNRIEQGDIVRIQSFQTMSHSGDDAVPVWHTVFYCRDGTGANSDGDQGWEPDPVYEAMISPPFRSPDDWHLRLP
jgi:hypothetical protein